MIKKVEKMLKKIVFYCPLRTISKYFARLRKNPYSHLSIFTLFNHFLYSNLFHEKLPQKFLTKSKNRCFLHILSWKVIMKSLICIFSYTDDDRFFGRGISVSISNIIVTHPCLKSIPRGVISCINFYFHFFLFHCNY